MRLIAHALKFLPRLWSRAKRTNQVHTRSQVLGLNWSSVLQQRQDCTLMLTDVITFLEKVGGQKEGNSPLDADWLNSCLAQF